MDADGAAVTHVAVECSLEDIARATYLRVEDVAFALNECGLLAHRLGEVAEEGTVVITRRLVEKIAKDRSVKRPCMSPGCVLLGD